jgi:methionyl-tRNA formyltransferase
LPRAGGVAPQFNAFNFRRAMRVLFIGTGEIGVPVLRWLLESREHELVGIVTQPDKPVGREQRIEAPPIKAAIVADSLPVFQPQRIKNAVEEIRALNPDVIVVMAYGQILPRAVLEIPRTACLNLHASLLPRHRGAAPIQAAIVAGDRETGISVIYMDEGLDTGDVLLQERIEIAPGETGGSLHDRLAQMAPAALSDALARLASGTAPRIPQDSSIATYAPKLEREDGKIDWNESAELIERKIRAFDPWPGAFTVLRDETGRARKLKVFRAHVGNERLFFRTKDAALVLDDVQLEGKRRMSADEFLRGYHSPLRLD